MVYFETVRSAKKCKISLVGDHYCAFLLQRNMLFICDTDACALHSQAKLLTVFYFCTLEGAQLHLPDLLLCFVYCCKTVNGTIFCF